MREVTTASRWLFFIKKFFALLETDYQTIDRQ
jgi:hypothetical protein